MKKLSILLIELIIRDFSREDALKIFKPLLESPELSEDARDVITEFVTTMERGE